MSNKRPRLSCIDTSPVRSRCRSPSSNDVCFSPLNWANDESSLLLSENDNLRAENCYLRRQLFASKQSYTALQARHLSLYDNYDLAYVRIRNLRANMDALRQTSEEQRLVHSMKLAKSNVDWWELHERWVTDNRGSDKEGREMARRHVEEAREKMGGKIKEFLDWVGRAKPGCDVYEEINRVLAPGRE